MEQTIMATEFDPKRYHIYDVKTKGKHPVHLIEGGSYLTESDMDFGDGDMGWFWLNSREYSAFNDNLVECVVDEDGVSPVNVPCWEEVIYA